MTFEVTHRQAAMQSAWLQPKVIKQMSLNVQSLLQSAAIEVIMLKLITHHEFAYVNWLCGHIRPCLQFIIETKSAGQHRYYDMHTQYT